MMSSGRDYQRARTITDPPMRVAVVVVVVRRADTVMAL